jgi:hypothetical protein
VLARNDTLLATYRKQFTVLRALGVTSFRPVYDPTKLDLYRELPTQAVSAVSLKVYFSYCVQTAASPPADRPGSVPLVSATEGFTARLTWILDRDIYTISAFALVNDDPRTRPVAPWLTDDVQSYAGKRVTIVAPTTLSAPLSQIAAAADQAADVAERFARWTKPTRYVVYVAGPTQWTQWFGGPGDQSDALGSAFNTSHSSVPVVLNFTHIAPGDLDLVLRHELGHVATLMGSIGGRGYLGEGMAEYVEQDGQPVNTYRRLGTLQRYLHSGAWDGDIDSANDTVYGPDATAASAAYGIGYLTWHCIADRYGETAMFAFFDSTARHARSAAEAAPTELGAPWPDIKATCERYIRTTVG